MSVRSVGIVGATGLVGQEVLGQLFDAEVDSTRLAVFGSAKSEGESLQYGDDELVVETLSAETLRGVKKLILAVPADAQESVQSLARSAGVEILSSAPSPAFHPWVGPVAKYIQLVQALTGKPSLLAIDYQCGAATFGMAGVDAMETQARSLMNGVDPDIEPFNHRLALNTLSGLPLLAAQGLWFDMPKSMLAEAFTGTQLSVSVATSPHFYGVLARVRVVGERVVSPATVRELLSKSQGFKVLDDASAGVFPTVQLLVGDEETHVGSISSDGLCLQCVVAFDPIRQFGARAVNWVQRGQN